jgi:hypothetical protein
MFTHELKDVHDEEHRGAPYCTVAVSSSGICCDMQPFADAVTVLYELFSAGVCLL